MCARRAGLVPSWQNQADLPKHHKTTEGSEARLTAAVGGAAPARCAARHELRLAGGHALVPWFGLP